MVHTARSRGGVIDAMTALGFPITNSMVVIWIVGLSLIVFAQARRDELLTVVRLYNGLG